MGIKEAQQIAKMFMDNSGWLICWTEIKTASKKRHPSITKHGTTYDIFGRDIAKMKFRKTGPIWQGN